jgi:hypothetical protein
MNTIEDRIRAAANAAAETVPPDGVPPLQLPAGRARRPWSVGSAWTRRLAPVWAAVAMVVVIIAVVTVSRAVHDSASRPSPAAPGTIASYVASGQVPPFYTEINGSGSDAAVRATATGKTLATIRPAAGDLIVAVSAADDGTFVLAERPHPGTIAGTFTFYEFRLSSAGRPGTLTRLRTSLPGEMSITGFALSPAADRLAIAGTPGHHEEEIRVVTLATGAVRTWTASGVGSVIEDVMSLSWTQNEQTLAFAWDGAGTRLLSLDAASGNLVDASREAFSGIGHGWACMTSAMITPDGRLLVCGARARDSIGISNDQIGYAEYAVTSGKLEQVLGQRLAGPTGPTLGWMNASGSVLIGGVQPVQNSPLPTLGVITGNRFLPLPGSLQLTAMSIAW